MDGYDSRASLVLAGNGASVPDAALQADAYPNASDLESRSRLVGHLSGALSGACTGKGGGLTSSCYLVPISASGMPSLTLRVECAFARWRQGRRASWRAFPRGSVGTNDERFNIRSASSRPSFRCIIRCLHRKGCRMSCQPQQRLQISVSLPQAVFPVHYPVLAPERAPVDRLCDLVPMLCVGMPSLTLRVECAFDAGDRDAERPGEHSHAGAWERDEASIFGQPPADRLSGALSGACTGKGRGWSNHAPGRNLQISVSLSQAVFPVHYPVLAPERAPVDKLC